MTGAEPCGSAFLDRGCALGAWLGLGWELFAKTALPKCTKLDWVDFWLMLQARFGKGFGSVKTDEIGAINMANAMFGYALDSALNIVWKVFPGPCQAAIIRNFSRVRQDKNFNDC